MLALIFLDLTLLSKIMLKRKIGKANQVSYGLRSLKKIAVRNLQYHDSVRRVLAISLCVKTELLSTI